MWRRHRGRVIAAAEGTPTTPLSGGDHPIAGSCPLRVTFVRESRVEEAPAEAVTVEGSALWRCDPCDVAWYGDADTGCWFCGSPGHVASATRRIVADENAA